MMPLIELVKQMRERLHERERFLLAAVHELLTPIAIMQIRIEGMKHGKERRRLLDDIARLGEMAEHLLNYETSMQARQAESAVDLVDLTRAVVADLAPIAVSQGYDISFTHDLEKVSRLAEPAALRRAISNLVRNAVDHGGGQGAISVAVSSLGEISVRDEGPGIPKELQAFVFEPFYRVVPRRTGAGLGLSLVKQIISSYGGEIRLDSGCHGTCFTIVLPERQPAD